MPIATPEKYAEMLDAAKAGRLRLPGDQRLVLADAERRAAGLRRRRLRRDHPGLHRRRGVPLRARPSRTWSPARWPSRRTPREVAKNYPVNIALHTDHCPKDKLDGFVRPLLDISVERVGAGRGAAVPVAHVGRLRGAAGGEPADRPGAARDLRQGQDRPRDRGRRRRRRGGRHRRRDRREALLAPPRTRSRRSPRWAPARTAAT